MVVPQLMRNSRVLHQIMLGMQTKTAGQDKRGIIVLTRGSRSALGSRDPALPSEVSEGHEIILPQAGIVEPSSACSTNLHKQRETKLTGIKTGAADPTDSSGHRNKSSVFL